MRSTGRGRAVRDGWVAGVALLLVMGLAGCNEENCTEIGCFDGFTMTLRPEGDRFPVGSYRVTLTPSVGPAEECEFEITDDPDDCPSGHCLGDHDCDGIFTIGVFATDRVVMHYAILEGPLLVDVEVDGAPRASFQLAADYRTIRPNGDGCPPECMVAEGDIEVPDS